MGCTGLKDYQEILAYYILYYQWVYLELAG